MSECNVSHFSPLIDAADQTVGVKQVNSDVMSSCVQGLFKSPDTLKPILFVQYGNSCIDLYLCGLNIKHTCVLKKQTP